MRLAPSSAVSHAVEAASGAAGRALAACGVAPTLPAFLLLLGCVWAVSLTVAWLAGLATGGLRCPLSAASRASPKKITREVATSPSQPGPRARKASRTRERSLSSPRGSLPHLSEGAVFQLPAAGDHVSAHGRPRSRSRWY